MIECMAGRDCHPQPTGVMPIYVHTVFLAHLPPCSRFWLWLFSLSRTSTSSARMCLPASKPSSPSPASTPEPWRRGTDTTRGGDQGARQLGRHLALSSSLTSTTIQFGSSHTWFSEESVTGCAAPPRSKMIAGGQVPATLSTIFSGPVGWANAEDCG
ncbi:hypothetical protein BP00DRAFT_175113 [Aspergillus indologenus CBS 114.80]|uniref:Uncharacterized protein n=1 Tax=Aspergillus indologenus CBS 114.80 TaxID=1450541 RepID=A0A2V5I3T0_9EURO|nr:hypothetical protein BP00DRAFT_175113 [Aspergillus indologenus CBS 114.80]